MNRTSKTVTAAVAAFSLMLVAAGCGGGAGKEDRGFYTSGSREADQRADQRMAKDAQLKEGGEQDGVSTGNKVGEQEMTGPNGVPKADEKKTLYDRLGGEAGVQAIVDDFVVRVLADPQVNWERKGVKQGGLSINRGRSVEWQPSEENVARLKKHLAQYISLKAGGPSVYEGREMKSVHEGMHITNTEFDASVGDLKATLDKLQIPNQEQKELLAIIESTRTQVSETR